MTDRKNIDRLFQEKFKDFEVSPPDEVWTNIEAELREKENKKRIIPFWFRLAGVAAALLLGIFVLYQIMGNGDQKDPVVESNDSEAPINAQDKIQNENSLKDRRLNKLSPTENQNIVTDASNDGEITNDQKDGVTNSNSGIGSDEKYIDRSNNRAKADNLEKRVGSSVAVQDKANSLKRNADSTLDQRQVGFKNTSVAENNRSINEKKKGGKFKTNSVTADDYLKSRESAVASPNNATPKTEIKNTEPAIAGSNNAIPKTDQIDDYSPKDIAIPDPNLNPVAATSQEKSDSEKKIDTVAVAAAPNALEELLKEKEKEEEVTKELKLNRWQITSNVAPIYFGSTSNGSPLDSRFESTDKTYKPSLSYGLGLQYAVNKKLAVRTGFNTISLEYNTNGVVFFQTPNARQLDNVDANLKGSLLEIDAQSSMQNNVFGRINNKFSGVLTQKTGYIEVPVEVTYKLVDRRFGIKLIGGVSTLFLNQNEVSILSPGLEMNIGEANNLNKLHYSTNIGLGLKYDILKSLQFNIDPTFKYQINTYSNNVGDFKPYIFGVYTGLSYRF